MSRPSPRASVAPLHRRCWCCEKDRPHRGGRDVLDRKVWVCERCMNHKVFPLITWFFGVLPSRLRNEVFWVLGRRFASDQQPSEDNTHAG